MQDEAQLVRAAERERLRALVGADIEAADRVHAEDFRLITPTGGVLGKNEYLGAIARGDVDYLAWDPEELEVRLYHDAAVVRYRARLQVSVRGAPDAPSGHFWHMDVYEKRAGRWQVVWSQATQVR